MKNRLHSRIHWMHFIGRTQVEFKLLNSFSEIRFSSQKEWKIFHPVHPEEI